MQNLIVNFFYKNLVNANKIKKNEKAKDKNIRKIGTKVNKEVFDEIAQSNDLNEKLIIINLCNKNILSTFLIILIYSIHCFIQGFLIGLIQFEKQLFLIYFFVYFRILFEIHTLSCRLILTKIDNMIYIILILFFSLITPLGIFLGLFFLNYLSFEILSFLFSFSAGTFIYISTIECILEEFEIGLDKNKKFILFFSGVLICSLLF